MGKADRKDILYLQMEADSFLVEVDISLMLSDNLGSARLLFRFSSPFQEQGLECTGANSERFEAIAKMNELDISSDRR